MYMELCHHSNSHVSLALKESSYNIFFHTSSLMIVALLSDLKAEVIFLPKSAKTILDINEYRMCMTYKKINRTFVNRI